MRARLPCLAAALLLSTGCRERGVMLLEDGRAAHRIVLEPGASPSERQAALELQSHFEACTGVKLPIQEGRPDAGSMIVLGRGEIARSLGVDPAPAALGEQGALVRTVRPHLVVAGTAEGGTLYAVHRLLERHLGVRWLAPGSTLTPRTANVLVPATDEVVRPAFLFRDTSYAWPGHDDAFLSRVAENAGSGGTDEAWGATHAHDGRAHSYFRFVSPDEFYDAHPEYFSEIGGVRRREETQLCLTNPDVLEIVTARMLERMAAQPRVRQHNFSQMDRYNGCECEKCREINERYGTAGGTQFWFVNRLAERTAQVFPDKLVGTLSYMYTEEPPVGLELHPNVAVWLCHMYPSCDAHPIRTCPLNAEYRRRAQAWARLGRHLYVWHYVTNFAHYYEPFPNLRAMAADLRFYRDLGVEGVYLQGMGHAGGGGEWSLLRPWYGMKLLQDPDADPSALLDDFLKGYYGAAGGEMHTYIDRLHDEVETKDVHMHLYTNPAQGYLPDALLEQANQQFDRAEDAAGADEELLERVRVARMPLVYASLFPRNGYALRDGQLQWAPGIVAGSELVAFLDRMRAHGFRNVREVSGGPETLLLIYAILSKPLEVVRISNASLEVDVVPMLAGRALRIADKATGKIATAMDVRRALFYPFTGGLEDRVGDGFDAMGWVEPASVKSRTATSVVTTARTLDGLDLERRLSVAESGPVLRVRSSVTNPGPSPRAVRLRAHLELASDPVRAARLRYTSRAGAVVDTDMTRVLAGLRQGEHLYDQDAPKGNWEFVLPGGLRVTQRFDDAEVDFTWVYAFPEDLKDLESEVWTRRVVLGPGETRTFEHEIEVRAD